MGQYYPQQGPLYPPEQAPEYYDEGDYEYYEEDISGQRDGNSLLQMGLAFFSGGCLVFLCVSVCALFLAVLWVLDPGAESSEAAMPESDIGRTFDDPAFSTESVVNDEQLQLTILDVNRDAQLEAIPQVEGREAIVTTIELVNLGEETVSFNERDFMLLNGFEEAYTPTVGAIAGSLGRGSLPPGEGLEGRLVFEVIAGEFDLRLLWEPRGSEPRYIYLE